METEKSPQKKITKVKCSVCKELKYVNPKALEKRIQKYGSVEEIESNWVCSKCLISQNE